MAEMTGPSFDVELSLREPTSLSIDEIDHLKSNFLIEDRSENGWGIVLRLDKSNGLMLNELLRALIKACEPFESIIALCKPVVRIAVFNPNVNCTVWIDETACFAKIRASLEVSVYPAD
ncbi:hypothetical protein [Methylococcus sp. EFPC2]|uniref:hypothetical protein n=1 Tax=Methylococcus sp. EFPC2 TaxID=2812648 RepID=UPI001967749E|nr:hypothetical protein [Methylococcus sp. EFPC2]QSA96123.1 hypothetical protein JWZ97_12870 [Methylococcus sp. EFPC2]